MNPPDCVVVATLGRSDVQVAREIGEGRYAVHTLADRSQRAFHEDCERGAISWAMLPLDVAAPLEDRRNSPLTYDRAGKRLLGTEPEGLTVDVARGVILAAPLLGRLDRQLAARRDAGRLGRVVEALLLFTRRPDGRDDEPIAAAHLVRDAIVKAWGLAPEHVHEVAYLVDGDLYETDLEGNRHLHVAAARRVDAALREAATRHPEARLALADVGGLPEVKPVLAASAGYRFGNRVSWLRPTERIGDIEDLPSRRLPPTLSLITRHWIRLLLDRGDIAAAAHLAVTSPGGPAWIEPWRGWLKGVADVLAGAPKNLKAPPSEAQIPAWLRRLPVDDLGFQAAFRVESALRREDWVIAFRETFTFRDAARESLLNRLFSRDPARPWIDFRAMKIRPELSTLSERELTAAADITGFRARPQAILESLERLLPDRPRRALSRLTGLLNKRLQSLRNLATHSAVDAAGVAEIKGLCFERGVWSKPGRFLATEAAAGLLAELGCPNGAKEWDNLVDALARDMDEFSLLP